MASKLVTDRQKSAEAVIAITHSRAETTGAALIEQLTNHLEPGEEAPDLTLFMRLMSRFLRQRTLDMVAADKANLAELADDEPVRERRDQATEAVSSRLIALRETVRGAYGTDAANRLFTGSTPTDPIVLARMAAEVADRLEETALPAPRFPGLSLNVAAVARELRTLGTELENAIADLAREAREAQAALVDKQRAMAAYDASFANVAALVSSVLSLTDQPELAARVRPSRSRPGRVAERSQDTPDPIEDPSTDPADEPVNQASA